MIMARCKCRSKFEGIMMLVVYVYASSSRTNASEFNNCNTHVQKKWWIWQKNSNSQFHFNIVLPFKAIVLSSELHIIFLWHPIGLGRYTKIILGALLSVKLKASLKLWIVPISVYYFKRNVSIHWPLTIHCLARGISSEVEGDLAKDVG